VSGLERTLLIVKPDGVRRGHVGEVLRRVEAKGYTLAALDLRVPARHLLAEHYTDLSAKPFYGELIDFMSSGPVMAAAVEGWRAVEGLLTLCGPTDPTLAPPGTIRGDLGHDWGNGLTENVVHRSDGVHSAQRELKLWFPELAPLAGGGWG
jgi:nucleoside-diphosphate kinase